MSSRQFIPFYYYRNNSEKFDATRQFVSQHWRWLLWPLLCVLVPLALWQSHVIITDYYVTDNYDYVDYWTTRRSVHLLVPSLLAFVMASAVIWTIMQFYLNRTGQLEGLKPIEFLKSMPLNVYRSIMAIVTPLLIFIMIGAFLMNVFADGVVFMFIMLGIPILLSLIMPLLISPPACIMGKVNFFKLPMHVWHILKNSFGSFFSLLLMLTLISVSLWWVSLLPIGLTSFMSDFLFDSQWSGDLSTLGNVAMHSIYTVCVTIFYLVMSMWILASGYHYSSCVEIEQDLSLQRDIENFDRI